MPSFSLVTPTTVEAAIAELRTGAPGEVAVLAGGTDLVFDLDRAGPNLRRVLSLRCLPWRTLDWNGPVLTVGSTLPLRSLEEDPDVARRHPGLFQAIRAVGGVPLRHRATLGGNLGRAAPASDLLPVLLVLDAEVDVVGPSGSRSVSVDQFLLGSRRTTLARGELIRSVRFPEPRPSAYLWQRVRPANDISQVAVAAAFSPSDRHWRLAVGGIPPRAVRLPEAERALSSPDPTREELGSAAEHATHHLSIAADRRASEEYRRHLVGVLLERAVRSASARSLEAGRLDP
ncbi:MAG TPA: FAD binding domain-containing protein [Thermoplasmata archaeon]|nr:FAD binding domain-containing protein [Thermoplasmata archaeon]